MKQRTEEAVAFDQKYRDKDNRSEHDGYSGNGKSIAYIHKHNALSNA